MATHVCMHVLHKLGLVPSSPVETYWDQPSKNDFKWQAWWVICSLGLPVSGFLLSSVLITSSVITGFYPSLTSLVRDGEMFREGFKDCLCILHLCLLVTNDLAQRPSAHPKLRNTTWRSGERGRAASPSSCCPGEGPVSGQGHKAAFQPSSPLAGGDSSSLRLASRY